MFNQTFTCVLIVKFIAECEAQIAHLDVLIEDLRAKTFGKQTLGYEIFRKRCSELHELEIERYCHMNEIHRWEHEQRKHTKLMQARYVDADVSSPDGIEALELEAQYARLEQPRKRRGHDLPTDHVKRRGHGRHAA